MLHPKTRQPLTNRPPQKPLGIFPSSEQSRHRSESLLEYLQCMLHLPSIDEGWYLAAESRGGAELIVLKFSCQFLVDPTQLLHGILTHI